MNINLQLSDSTYQRLVSAGGRLVSPTEGNFNEHAKYTPRPGNKYIKLRHGRASVGDSQVRLTLRIALDEADIVPAQTIEEESRQASAFVDTTCSEGRGDK